MGRFGRWLVGVVVVLMLAAGLTPAQAQVVVRVGPRHRGYYRRGYYGHPYHHGPYRRRGYYRHHGYYR